MSWFAGLFTVIMLVTVGLLVFLNSSPSAIANGLRAVVPILLAGTGLGLTLFGRVGIGIMLIAAGLGLWARNSSVKPIRSRGGQGRKSTVRSAWLEMELDHDTGDLAGWVLTGPMEGRALNDLSDEEVVSLYTDLSGDGESAALLAAYLDRRIPLWREDLNPDDGAGEAAAPASGPMTKQEAYQILGLSFGASADEIKRAHRRLMKQVHPDTGGSAFLAAKLNEAKDVLLN